MLSNLIWWVVVGLIAGWAAGKIMRGGGYGPLMDIVLGIVGAIVVVGSVRHLCRRPDRNHRGCDHRRHVPDLALSPAEKVVKEWADALVRGGCATTVSEHASAAP